MGGDWNALPDAGLHTLGRSVLIASGLYAAGERDMQKLGRYAFGAAVAIECFALIWAACHQGKK